MPALAPVMNAIFPIVQYLFKNQANLQAPQHQPLDWPVKNIWFRAVQQVAHALYPLDLWRHLEKIEINIETDAGRISKITGFGHDILVRFISLGRCHVDRILPPADEVSAHVGFAVGFELEQ